MKILQTVMNVVGVYAVIGIWGVDVYSVVFAIVDWDYYYYCFDRVRFSMFLVRRPR
jgi:hypothetical protein